jgi:hypothetical protein
VKKCVQCGQTLNDDNRFCHKCGGSVFEEDAGSCQQPVYQQPVYRPPYQEQAATGNREPATIGDYIVFFLLQLIPIFNIVYTIIVAVGSPSRKVSMTNLARAVLILWAIGLVLVIVLAVIGTFSMFSVIGNHKYYYY